MNIEVIKSGKGRYKIISRGSKKHPLLKHIAEMAKVYNKYSDIKIGIYNIPNNEFCFKKSVYSYISDRTTKMTKKEYYEFLNGKRQIKGKKNMEVIWSSVDPNKNEKFVLDFLD